MFKSKQTRDQKLQSSLTACTRKLQIKKPLRKIQLPLKGWLATKPVHPVACVSLPTQYKNQKLDLVYRVVEGNFSPLLGCDACLDLEVLKFMNLQLIDTPAPRVASPETLERDGDESIFQD